ncbi:MAG: phosphoribosylformylglycinamidine cyclo-ligase [Christensenellales bacterium]
MTNTKKDVMLVPLPWETDDKPSTAVPTVKETKPEISYKDAGVNVDAGYEAVKLMQAHVSKTLDQNVIKGLANFGGLYKLEGTNQVLVAGTDGVGTKLKVAFTMDKHDTVGIDCVAMCANDVVCHGAKPVLFLDYIALSKLVPAKVAQIVAGVSEGCIQAGCALLGGETAEMPGFYAPDEYDLAGFCVGTVDADKIIDGSKVAEGDVLIGLASSGVHSNGFSLVRRLFRMDMVLLSQVISGLDCPLGEELIKPTRIYVKTVLELCRRFSIHGIAHITGGGFIENIPRIMPQGLRAKIEIGSWPVLPIFSLLQREGNMTRESIFNTFNMGIGMVLAVDKKKAKDIIAAARSLGEKAYKIGSVISGKAGVELCE